MESIVTNFEIESEMEIKDLMKNDKKFENLIGKLQESVNIMSKDFKRGKVLIEK